MKKGTMEKNRAIWWLGVLMFAGGNVFNFWSFSLAPQSFLASLSAIQFVTNVFFASCLLGEKITGRIIGATVVIVIGVLIAVRCATHTAIHYTVDDFFDMYRTVYNMYLLVQFILLITLQYVYVQAPDGAAYAPVCYAAVSAIIGTQAAVQSKCVSEMLLDRKGHSPSLWWFPYAVGCLLFCAQVFWLVRMQRALGKFSGAVIIPLLQVFWTSFSILTGGLYFKEFISMDLTRGLTFIFGLLVLFLGVYLLVPSDEDATASLQAQLEHRASVFLGPGIQLLGVNDLMEKLQAEEDELEIFPPRLSRISRRLTLPWSDAASLARQASPSLVAAPGGQSQTFELGSAPKAAVSPDGGFSVAPARQDAQAAQSQRTDTLTTW